jgi:hypothetical protein
MLMKSSKKTKPLAAAALTLAGCGGPKVLTLPTDPVDRAATCAVVAAAEARLAVKDVQAPLPLAAQGRIVHYALLAASADGRFDAETANAVNRRMKAIEGKVTGGRWQALSQPCRDAYPAAIEASPALPGGRLDAGLSCEELAEFMANAFEGRKPVAHEVSEYRALRGRLNERLAPALKARVRGGFEAQQAEGRKALVRAAGLGPPTAVLDLCLKRFG